LTTKGLGENLVAVVVVVALFGHVGGSDPRMVSEMRRLQQRVRDLEAELMRLQEENDALAEEAAHSEDMLVLEREPALA
jgi:cell division protein FtsB